MMKFYDYVMSLHDGVSCSEYGAGIALYWYGAAVFRRMLELNIFGGMVLEGNHCGALYGRNGQVYSDWS